MTPQTKHPNHAHARTLVFACLTTSHSIGQAASVIAPGDTANLFMEQASRLRLLAENLNASIDLAVETETAFANCPPNKTYEFGQAAVHENGLLRTAIAETSRALADAWNHDKTAWALALRMGEIDDLAATLDKP